MQEEKAGRGLLGKYFPMIRTREEIVKEIGGNERLSGVYESWNPRQRERFLDACTGVRGVKLLYDAFFKEVMNPEYAPERLESFLSLILKQKVKVVQVLPPDSARIADESALLVMDIVVQLADGSITNVEVQKIGYRFPGERCACYSADLLLRQYRRVREDWDRKERERIRAVAEEAGYDGTGEELPPSRKRFSYQNIKNVYTIVLFEKSPEPFHEFESIYLHHAEQKTDTGLKINLLQEYHFIALDIFRKTIYNKGIQDELDAWLVFLSVEEPEQIVELLEKYPKFRPMYEQVYEMCRSTERVMGMFSRELKELDDNTVEFMIDELKELADKEKARAEEAEARAEEERSRAEEAEARVEEERTRAIEAEKEKQRAIKEIEEEKERALREAEKEKERALQEAEELRRKYEELLRQGQTPAKH